MSLIVGQSAAVRAATRAHYFERRPHSSIIRPEWVGTVPTAEPTGRGRYQATLRWTALLDGFWFSEVVNEAGAVIEAGVGNNVRRAYLKHHERMIPPE